ncbi:MAG: tesA 2 [Acidobacteria bacterium]|nr:tesA 2 [Acidobacteriota bacterium]
MCLGDSLTSGHGIGTAAAFPALLHQRVRRAGLPFEVINAGVSRQTSADARARLDRALEGDVRVLIVALGANDGLRGVPVAQLTDNLGHIIETAQKRGIAVLLCAMAALPIYGWEYTAAFHQAYIALAARHNVPLVPFFLQNVIGDARLMQGDYAHPNADGARAIADVIWPYLEQLLATGVGRPSAVAPQP